MTQGMVVERVPIEEVHIDPANARKGSVPVIVESLREFGQHRPLVVQKSSGKIIAGNHTYQAAVALGWSHIDVFRVEDDDLKATRRAIADNATGDAATWDDEVLSALLQEVGTDVPGIDEATLNRLAQLDADKEFLGEPTYPLIPKPGEHYSYVLIVSSSALDETWLATVFGLEKERSYKNSAVGLSRTVTVDKFRRMLPQISASAQLVTDD